LFRYFGEHEKNSKSHPVLLETSDKGGARRFQLE
jgi:hypothetical protein